jgi:hypothetical protein
LSGPSEITADQQFGHLGMMGVLHSNRLQIKPILLCQITDAPGIFVGHEQVASKVACDPKEFLVVKFKVGIKPCTSFLARNGIGRINEKDSIRAMSILPQYFEAITFDKGDALPKVGDVHDPLLQSLRIPT